MIFIALALIAFFGFAMMAFDMSFLYVLQADLQVAATAAATAAATEARSCGLTNRAPLAPQTR